MARRIANLRWFSAEGAVVPWQAVAERHRSVLRRFDPRGGTGLDPERERELKVRPVELQLRWACAPEVGVPLGPFVVWLRPPSDRVVPTGFERSSHPGGLGLQWGFTAATVEVDCDVLDPARPVGLVALRGRWSLDGAVGAAAAAGSGGRVTVRVRCSGATRALLVNGANPVVRAESLDDVVHDPAWDPFEVVGLPVDQPWPGTDYDTGPQGLVGREGHPVDAAVERLVRGGPPLGWWPVTGSGRLAPRWDPPDPKLLVEEVRTDLLVRIAGCYRAGLGPGGQARLVTPTPVDPPHRGSVRSALPTTAEVPPLSVLLLAATSDPFLALATGFGTAYPIERMTAEQTVVGRVDALITARYEDTPWRTGPVDLAAYVPAPAPHGELAPATALAAAQAGLIEPARRDDPWRQSVRVSWDRVAPSAALGRPVGVAAARFDPTGGPDTESLIPRRDAGGWRPLLPTPDGPPGSPGADRSAFVDPDIVIPIGSGGRSLGYAVALEDSFGIWAPWTDVLTSTGEPGPPLPRVISLVLAATFAGSATCPARLTGEVAVDWADRTPTRLELSALFFPMATAASPPPVGSAPAGAVPPGTFRRTVVIDFLGDVPVAPVGVTVEPLDTAGERVVAPGPLQGDHGRRYRIGVDVPTLDFSATRRWGVQLWARTTLAVLPGPGPWVPDATHPALAAAGSPVPVVPLPPPAPPGVPLASTPDAQGRCHARVSWSLPAGAEVAKVIVWEVAETALRQAAGLPPRAAEGTLPGSRLDALWTAYDGLSPVRRRSVFRRLLELDGRERAVDVALPKGSTDIHLFVVTTVSTTMVDSPWPDAAVPHTVLQAAIAPRLRRPAPPVVRPVVNPDGTVTMALSAASRVPVASFRLYRTRSVVAARSPETMGPAFATVAATAAPGPADPVTGEATFTAGWTGGFDPSWDEWFVRVVAVPVDTVPAEAVRGVPSAASEPQTVRVVPPGPPDLAPLVADTWGAAHDGVVVRTSTSAPVRGSDLGAHRVTGTAGGVPVAALDLPLVPEDPAVPPAGAAAAPVLVRGPRAGGRTPLALWFTRPVAADPVTVVLRLVDPLGRVTERTVTVPGWVPPGPQLLEIVDVRTIAGRGSVLAVRCDAPVGAGDGWRMRIVATPGDLAWWRGGPRRPPWPRPRPVVAEVALHAIPTGRRPFRPSPTIQVQRTTPVAPFEYQVWVGLQPRFTVGIEVIGPDGARLQAHVRV